MWLALLLPLPCVYVFVSYLISCLQGFARMICSGAWLTLRYIAESTNRAMARLVIWALLKRPARCVALCGHRRSWALRAGVLLLACHTRSGVAPLNVVPLPHTNRPRRRHQGHKQHPPASLWNVGFIHWYIHLFMLCRSHVLPHGRPGEALSVPHHRYEFWHHAPTPGTEPPDQIPRDVQPRLITLSHDVHPNPW